MIALTSLSPSPDRVTRQRAAIASWRAAGLDIRSFQYAAESRRIQTHYHGLDLITVPGTGIHVPISTMLRWAAEHSGPVLLINSDIELRLQPWEMKRFRWLSAGGLCWFVRHNYVGSKADAIKEMYG